MTEPNAILAVSSLDRFTNNAIAFVEDPPGSGNIVPVRQPVLLDLALYQIYRGNFVGGVQETQSGNNFVIESTNAILYGYIKTIGVSQVQIDYHMPTVIPERNDLLAMLFRIGNTYYAREITIPYGFYTPDELAAMLTILIRQEGIDGEAFFPDFDVIYAPTGLQDAPPNAGGGNGFIFACNWGNQTRGFGFAEIPPDIYGFPDPPPGTTPDILKRFLGTARLLGITLDIAAGFPAGISSTYLLTKSPNFIYTPYIDICSSQLTKYQKVKDSDTSPIKRNNILARVYLSAIGSPQNTSGTEALGSHPFLMTVDLNTAKTIRWDRDEAIYSLDFQLYDIYGDPIFWSTEYPTEFQMTLMCSEGAG